MRAIVDLCREFAVKYPAVQLHLYIDTLSAVSTRVLDGSCQIGIVGSAAHVQGLEREHLTSVRMVPVAASTHPLAQVKGRIPTKDFAGHVNIVLSERGGTRQTEDQAILSSNTWRVTDLGTKHALLLGGLGWGNMPEHLVKEDLATGRLVRLRVAAWGEDTWLLSMTVVHRPDVGKGPATRWLLKRLGELCPRELGPSIEPL